jgi:hypothetical protein
MVSGFFSLSPPLLISLSLFINFVRATDHPSGGARRGFIVRKFSAPGEAGGDVEGDEAFAGARVADEECHLAEGDFFGPQPFDVLRGAVGGAD